MRFAPTSQLNAIIKFICINDLFFVHAKIEIYECLTFFLGSCKGKTFSNFFYIKRYELLLVRGDTLVDILYSLDFIFVAKQSVLTQSNCCNFRLFEACKISKQYIYYYSIKQLFQKGYKQSDIVWVTFQTKTVIIFDYLKRKIY